MDSALNYVAADPLVQMVFLLVACVGSIGWMVNRRVMKKQEYERDERQEARRERFMALPSAAQKARTIEGE